MSRMLEIAGHAPATRAEGPGLRFALWVQGCSLRCPGCCNPGLFPTERGRRVAVDALLDTLDRVHASHPLEGLTVLGGEPLEQLEPVTALCQGAAQRGLGVLVFSGFRRSEARTKPGFAELWATIDTLVDGRFDRTQPEPSPEQGGRRWIGSRNQRLHHRTARYRDDRHWRGEPVLEVYVDHKGALEVHGAPVEVEALLRAVRDPATHAPAKPVRRGSNPRDPTP